MKKLKKLLCLLLTAVTLVSLFSVSAYAEDDADTGSANSDEVSFMLIYGDSLPSGYGLDGYDPKDNSKPKDSFANLLCRYYGLGYGRNFYNFSKTGRTSAEVLADVMETDTSLLKKADVIIISAGGNDVIDIAELTLYKVFADEEQNLKALGVETDLTTLGGIEKTIMALLSDSRARESLDRIIKRCAEPAVQNTFSNTTLKYEANMKSLVSYIREVGSDAEIILMTPYDPLTLVSGNEITESIDKMLTDINNKAIGLTESKEYGYGLHVLDLLTEFRENILVWTNAVVFDIHPNKDGHSHIFDMLKRDITNYLSKKNIENSTKADKKAPFSDTAVYIIFGVACVCVIMIIIHTFLSRRKKN